MFLLPFRLCILPLLSLLNNGPVVRQRLHTQQIEELLDDSFSMWSVFYQMKVDE
jgi:hypothetical protein